MKNKLLKLLGLFLIFIISFSSVTFAASTRITHEKQVVDSITCNGVKTNAVYAPYTSISGYSSSTTYSCAAFVKKFYNNVYGVTVYNLLKNGGGPLVSGSSNVFVETTTPQVGDILHDTTQNTHWAIVKEINTDGTVTIIEQNAWADYERKTARVGKKTPIIGSGYKYYHYSGAVKTEKNSAGNQEISSKSIKVTTGKADYTETNAVLYGSADVTGGKLTECGMYFGTSKNNLKFLGCDKVSGSSTNMWYSTSKYLGTSLDPGTTYYYQAYAKSDGLRNYGDIKSFTTKGAKYIAPVVTSISAPKISLSDDWIDQDESSIVSWNSVGNNVKYYVEIINQNTGKKTTKTTKSTSYALSYLEPATYKISVFGENDYMCSLNSNVCQLVVSEVSAPKPGKPEIHLSDTNVTVGESIEVTWHAVEYADKYKVKYSCDLGDFTKTTTSTSITISDMVAGEYNIRVYAINDVGTTKSSKEYFTVKEKVISDPGYTGYVTGTNGSLAINSQPSKGSQIGEIPEGSSCRVYASKASGNWLWVEYNGVSGYAYNRYISTSKPALPSVPEPETIYTPPVEPTYTGYVSGTNGLLAINRDPSAGSQVGTIPEGAACTVYPNRGSGNWLWVEYNGVSGYSYNRYISTSKPAPAPTMRTYTGMVFGTNGLLAINSQPSAGYQIGTIPEGAYCTIYPDKKSGNWLWAEYNGISGYVYNRYIAI